MTYDLDRRTRLDEDRRLLALDAFFAEDVPRLAAAHGRLVADGIKALEVRTGRSG